MILIITIVLGCIAVPFLKKYLDTCSVKEVLCVIWLISAWVLVLIMVVIACANHIEANAVYAEQAERCAILSYQLENDMYNNVNEVGKKSLYTDIAEYNSELAYNKTLQRDFWIGIFVPNIYDDLEFIELPK